jgi:hypothetical protein
LELGCILAADSEGEQFGSLMRIAAAENVSLCERMKS